MSPTTGEAKLRLTKAELWIEAILDCLNASHHRDSHESRTDGHQGDSEGWEVIGDELYVGVFIVVLARKGMRDKGEIGGVAKASVPCGALGGLMVSLQSSAHPSAPSLISTHFGGFVTQILQGNKAGVAIRMRIHASWVTFVVSHLAAHTDQLAKRQADYQTISSRIQFPFVPSEEALSIHSFLPRVAGGSQRPIELADPGAGTVFWAGDLNCAYAPDSVVNPAHTRGVVR